MHRIVLILFGSPGSGKGTQANLLATKLGLFHFDTGRYLESVVHDSRRQKEKVIRRERRLFDRGVLLTPEFVLRETSRQVRRLGAIGWGIVLSGSPRTLFEAKGLLPILQKTYGRKRIFIFWLNVPPAVSLKRNSARLMCTMCGAPLLLSYYPTKKPRNCPLCGGKLYKRTVDNPKTIAVRFREYHARTEPIFAYIRKRGYRIRRVSGTGAPFKTFHTIRRAIQKELTHR